MHAAGLSAQVLWLRAPEPRRRRPGRPSSHGRLCEPGHHLPRCCIRNPVDLLHSRERNARQTFRAEHRRAERREPDERDRGSAEAREPHDPRPSPVVCGKHVLLPRRQPAAENRMPLLQGRHRLRDPPRKDDGFAAGFLRHALPDLQDLYEPNATDSFAITASKRLRRA